MINQKESKKVRMGSLLVKLLYCVLSKNLKTRTDLQTIKNSKKIDRNVTPTMDHNPRN